MFGGKKFPIGICPIDPFSTGNIQWTWGDQRQQHVIVYGRASSFYCIFIIFTEPMRKCLVDRLYRFPKKRRSSAAPPQPESLEITMASVHLHTRPPAPLFQCAMSHHRHNAWHYIGHRFQGIHRPAQAPWPFCDRTHSSGAGCVWPPCKTTDDAVLKSVIKSGSISP